MTVKYVMSADEIRKMIPYELIAYVAATERHKLGHGKRLMATMFTEKEMPKVKKLMSLAKHWYLCSGVPWEYETNAEELEMWARLGKYASCV